MNLDGLVGQRVVVHRNLRTGGYTVKPNISGRVLGSAPAIVLEDVVFHIQKGGQKTCREKMVRGVHAYAIGTVVPLSLGERCRVSIAYHYTQDTFRTKIGKFPITHASRCRLDDTGAHVLNGGFHED